MPVAFPEPRDAEEAEGMKVLHAAIADRDKWMDETMKKHLPEKIYRAAHYGSKRGQLGAKKWLDRNEFEFREQGLITQLAIKGVVVASYDFNPTTEEKTHGTQQQ